MTPGWCSCAGRRLRAGESLSHRDTASGRRDTGVGGLRETEATGSRDGSRPSRYDLFGASGTLHWRRSGCRRCSASTRTGGFETTTPGSDVHAGRNRGTQRLWSRTAFRKTYDGPGEEVLHSSRIGAFGSLSREFEIERTD